MQLTQVNCSLNKPKLNIEVIIVQVVLVDINPLAGKPSKVLQKCQRDGIGLYVQVSQDSKKVVYAVSDSDYVFLFGTMPKTTLNHHWNKGESYCTV